MKAIKAPEKVYLLPRQGGDYAPYWRTNSQDGFEIEYTRTDAFIEKALNWMDDHLFFDDKRWLIDEQKSLKEQMMEDFKNYMKGE